MIQPLLAIRRVLISVFDKSNILNFAQSLIQQNIQLLSTGGTAQLLSSSGLSVLKISDYVKFPEIMNGRIKTLHHKIYAGILGRKGLDDSIMNQYDIEPIDMIIINFYPFDSIIQNKKYSQEEILEYIDIGGPSMVRAAAKNYKNVAIIINNDDYTDVLNEIKNYNGSLSLKTRLNLAAKALRYITEYDNTITNYFEKQLKNNFHTSTTDIHQNSKYYCHFPNTLNLMDLKFIKKQSIRYGENPHQRAAFYIETPCKKTGSIATSRQLQGKKLSYNNIIDMDTALECVKMFIEPTCVIVKHTNPCAVATANTISEAYNKAYQADPISSFGGIIALNRPLDKKTAQAIINQKFIEAVIVPSIHENCRNVISNKKNIRVLSCGEWTTPPRISDIDLKRINGGLLIQDYDFLTNLKNLEVVTTCQPTEEEMQNALFCWKIVKFVKSNAIVCAKNYQTTGIGMGQTNRLHATKIATSFNKTQKTSNIQGSVMASDAFFPFSDNILVAAKMGIRCIIQPGGSIRDQEIINAANKHNISMIFTHVRHFRH